MSFFVGIKETGHWAIDTLVSQNNDLTGMIGT